MASRSAATTGPRANRDEAEAERHHAAASRMVANGVTLFDVAMTLGHSLRSGLVVTMRYAHFAPQSEDDGMLHEAHVGHVRLSSGRVLVRSIPTSRRRHLGERAGRGASR